MPDWTLHDLRRSFVTHISEHGFAQPHVVEAIVNHISGAKAGVAGIYNRATYAIEKREALQRWATHLSSLLMSSAQGRIQRVNAGDSRTSGKTTTSATAA
jgi:hypothetical protein